MHNNRKRLTMTEELITLETAKLMKNKGFSECVFTFYEADGVEGDMILSETYDYSENFNKREGFLSAPSQSLVQKWLRETKNLHISIIRNACGYGYDICKADNGTHIADGIFKGPNDGGQWDTYEEALEVGIQEAIKLI